MTAKFKKICRDFFFNFKQNFHTGLSPTESRPRNKCV